MKAARHGDAPPPENRNEGGAMQPRTNALAERIYQQIKQAIFDFEFLPGDRFTEQEIAARFGVSRTPVRDALYRLEREGYLQVAFRSGWHVRPLDFRRFGELYDVRVLLEVAAVAQLCQTGDPSVLEPQREIWCVPPGERLRDGPPGSTRSTRPSTPRSLPRPATARWRASTTRSRRRSASCGGWTSPRPAASRSPTTSTPRSST